MAVPSHDHAALPPDLSPKRENDAPASVVRYQASSDATSVPITAPSTKYVWASVGLGITPETKRPSSSGATGCDWPVFKTNHVTSDLHEDLGVTPIRTATALESAFQPSTAMNGALPIIRSFPAVSVRTRSR